MSIPKVVTAQRDWSAGELDDSSKRADNQAIQRSGARQLRNRRIRSTGVSVQRPGRTARYLQKGRVDQVLMAPGIVYDLCFADNGDLIVRDSTGANIASWAGLPWRTATVDQVRWDVYRSTIFITFPGMQPQQLDWDGVTTWVKTNYTPDVTAGGQKRVPFYRLAPGGITVLTGALSGATTALFSAPVLTAASVGAVMRYQERQFTITAVADSQNANITINEPLYGSVFVQFTAAVAATFNQGDVVVGSVSTARGQVLAITAADIILVLLLDNKPFRAPDVVTGPNAQTGTVAGVTGTVPAATQNWDEEIFNAWRGWPQSVTVDQNRLIMTDFPALPGGIAWSAIGALTDLAVGTFPADGMFELSPRKGRVYNVAPAAQAADEIVFTDDGVFYIPISENNPLKPGSVTFRPISPEAAANVRPVRTAEAVLYVNAGLSRLLAVVGSGAASSVAPYTTRDISEYHTHLFVSIRALAYTTGDGQFPERYVYVLKADGTIAVGRYDLSKEWVGWVPWDGNGPVQWIFGRLATLTVLTNYGAGAALQTMVEALDVTQYVDAAVPINAVPAALAPVPGLGPLWWHPASTCYLMDGVKPLGEHAIDASGFVLPLTPDEDLTSPTLVAGQPYTQLVEPFVPHPEGGQDVGQRIKKRKIARAVLTVANSTGFAFVRLYSGKAGVNLPTPGAVIQTARIPPWNIGDNQANAPPLREDTYRFRNAGRTFDPRVAAMKDFPGPLELQEFALEVTV